jgi:hypothetical protein
MQDNKPGEIKENDPKEAIPNADANSPPGPQNNAPSGPKKPDRPHWTTFVVPTSSVLVSILSLFTVWYVFYTNQEISRATLRPFVSLTSRQLTAGVPSRDSKTGLVGPPVGAFVNIVMQNLGNTPAYEVEYEIQDEHFTCVTLGQKIAIAPHETREHKTFCQAPPSYQPPPENTSAIFYPKCRVIYRDGYKQSFDEPCRIAIQVGFPFAPDALMMKPD